MKKQNIALALVLGTFLIGCQPTTEITGETSNSQENTANQTNNADKDKLKKDLKQAEKRLAEGHALTPQVDLRLNIKKVNDTITIEDAERSFLFARAAFRRCYKNALGYDLNAKGEVSASLSRSGNETKVDNFISTLKDETFESCAREACTHWRLPDGATLDFVLDFSSTPAPTIDEWRKSHHDHGHEHDHDHAHAPEHDHDHAHAPEHDHDHAQETQPETAQPVAQ